MHVHCTKFMEIFSLCTNFEFFQNSPWNLKISLIFKLSPLCMSVEKWNRSWAIKLLLRFILEHCAFSSPPNPNSQGLPVSIFNGPNIRLNTNSILGQVVAKNLPATIFRSRSDDHFLWGNVNKRHTTRDRQCRCYKQKLVQQWTFDPHSLVPLKWHQASWIQKALWCKESKQFENYNQTSNYILQSHRVPTPSLEKFQRRS